MMKGQKKKGGAWPAALAEKGLVFSGGAGDQGFLVFQRRCPQSHWSG